MFEKKQRDPIANVFNDRWPEMGKLLSSELSAGLLPVVKSTLI